MARFRRRQTRLGHAVGAVVAILAVVLAGTARAEAQPEAPVAQWRGYWVDAFNEGIYTPGQVRKLINEALAVNANVLVVQVVRRYDCFCNRALYPRTDAAIDPAPYDPLDEVIEQAHEAGLEVHAWVNVGTLWNSATPPSSPDHVFNVHGPSAQGADRWLNKRHDGVERVGDASYLDLANPAAADYVVAAITSIVEEYDVDGVNLDYIRYPDHNSVATHSDWGYSEASLARFRAATGRADVPAPSDRQWSDWRREQVTNLVRDIYASVYDLDPTVRVSVNAITYGHGPRRVGGWEHTRPYAEVLQDWKGWLADGIVDTVLAMNYKRESEPDQARMFDEWNEALADWQGDRHAVSGPALYLNDVDDNVRQVRDVLAPTAAGNKLAGWNGYSYANASRAAAAGDTAVKDTERATLAAALTTGPDAPFADDAAVPAMPWKQNPPASAS